MLGEPCALMAGDASAVVWGHLGTRWAASWRLLWVLPDLASCQTCSRRLQLRAVGLCRIPDDHSVRTCESWA